MLQPSASSPSLPRPNHCDHHHHHHYQHLQDQHHRHIPSPSSSPRPSPLPSDCSDCCLLPLPGSILLHQPSNVAVTQLPFFFHTTCSSWAASLNKSMAEFLVVLHMCPPSGLPATVTGISLYRVTQTTPLGPVLFDALLLTSPSSSEPNVWLYHLCLQQGSNSPQLSPGLPRPSSPSLSIQSQPSHLNTQQPGHLPLKIKSSVGVSAAPKTATMPDHGTDTLAAPPHGPPLSHCILPRGPEQAVPFHTDLKATLLVGRTQGEVLCSTRPLSSPLACFIFCLNVFTIS